MSCSAYRLAKDALTTGDHHASDPDVLTIRCVLAVLTKPMATVGPLRVPPLEFPRCGDLPHPHFKNFPKPRTLLFVRDVQ